VRLAALALALTVGACQQQPVTRNEAIQLANDWMLDAGGNLHGLVPVVEEHPSNWMVTYTFDPPAPGGAPFLWVDKRTRQVHMRGGTQ